MSAGTVAADPLDAAWAGLRAFFGEGHEALRGAIAAFEAAEGSARAADDPARRTLWLLGLSTALRLTRRPEPMETALARARELVNLVARTQDEPATIPYRTHVEAIYQDLADVLPATAAESVAAGLAYSDRTLRLARRAGRDEWLAAALVSRGDLLLRSAGDDRRTRRRAVTLHEEARRRWPARDPAGRAQAALGYGQALLAAGDAARAELVAREALAVMGPLGDRYHEAVGRLLLARALFALDRTEALDEQQEAVALFRRLGCRWELGRAEGALT